MILDKVKFTQLVKNNEIVPALKSYADSLLFYYLGVLATTYNTGEIFEIGVGGSTYILSELSENQHRTVNLLDLNQDNLNLFSNTTNIYPGAIVNKLLISSEAFDQTMPLQAYIHLDGSKNYSTALNDLELAIRLLDANGLICQDDYGNNKWPTITCAVHYLLNKGIIRLLLVGDSSAWLVLPESYEFWINKLKSDHEFTVLSKLTHCTSSLLLDQTPEYFFMNTLPYCISSNNTPIDDELANYCCVLINNASSKYLNMPYYGQSKFGSVYLEPEYILTTIWDDIQGSSWPEKPINKKDIDALPTEVVNEITANFLSDIYATTYASRDSSIESRIKENIMQNPYINFSGK